MPPKRSTRSTANIQVEEVPASAATKKIVKSASPAFILIHQKLSEDEKETIITLPHPLSGKPSRYLLTPKALYEITAVQNPKTQPQSWLLVPKEDRSQLGQGETVSSGTAYITAQIDPLFLAIPTLFDEETKKERKRFVQIDDLTEKLTNASPHWARVLREDGPREFLESRIGEVSDTVDGGGELLYKPSEKKLIDVLLKRVEKMAEYLSSEKAGSLAQEFVSKPLVGPTVLAPSSGNVIRSDNGEEGEEKKDGENSEEKTGTKSEEEKEKENEASAAPAEDPNMPEIKRLQALLSAHTYLSQTLLPSFVSSELLTALKSAHDFTVLDAYIAKIKAARAELAAVRSSDFSMKRSYEGDEEEREEKRRKKEAEEEAEKKKKKAMSKAARDLEKVNTKGMMKLSAFFKKPAAK